MSNDTIKTILTGAVLVILFIVAIKLLSFAVKILLPVAIIIVAVYIIYMLVRKNRK